MMEYLITHYYKNGDWCDGNKAIPRDCLCILLCGDRGGRDEAATTKLTLTILNIKQPRNPRNTHVIGIFNGHEHYEPIQQIFKPLYDRVYQWCEQVQHSHIECESLIISSAKLFIGGDIKYLCALTGKHTQRHLHIVRE